MPGSVDHLTRVPVVSLPSFGGMCSDRGCAVAGTPEAAEWAYCPHCLRPLPMDVWPDPAFSITNTPLQFLPSETLPASRTELAHGTIYVSGAIAAPAAQSPSASLLLIDTREDPLKKTVLPLLPAWKDNARPKGIALAYPWIFLVGDTLVELNHTRRLRSWVGAARTSIASGQVIGLPAGSRVRQACYWLTRHPGAGGFLWLNTAAPGSGGQRVETASYSFAVNYDAISSPVIDDSTGRAWFTALRLSPDKKKEAVLLAKRLDALDAEEDVVASIPHSGASAPLPDGTGSVLLCCTSAAGVSTYRVSPNGRVQPFSNPSPQLADSTPPLESPGWRPTASDPMISARTVLRRVSRADGIQLVRLYYPSQP